MSEQTDLIEEACQDGNFKLLRFILLNKDSLSNKCNDDGLYPIHTSVLYNEWPISVDLLRILLEYGANINAIDKRSGDNLLNLVLLFNNPSTVQKMIPFLLSKGCNPLTRNLSGKSAIDLARDMGYYHYLRSQMIEYASSNYVLMHDLLLSQSFPILDNLKRPKKNFLRVLEKSDSKIQILNRNLVQAVILGDLESIKKLIFEGADPNFIDNDHYFPVHYAVSKQQTNSLEILKELNKKGANINVLTQEGDSVLTLAIKKIANEDVCHKVVEYLIKSKVPQDPKDHYHVHVSSSNVSRIENIVGRIEAILNLIELENVDGHNAYDLAKLRNLDSAMHLFSQFNKAEKIKLEEKQKENSGYPHFVVKNQKNIPGGRSCTLI